MSDILKYPVLLVHGMGFRDNSIISYWGRVPKTLKKMGCDIHYGHQDSSGSVEGNGEKIAARIDEILKKTNAEKVNIIAHSKGGLDCRYAISTLGMGDRVASLTTLATPHHGSKCVDILLKLPDFLVRVAGFCTDCWFRIIGDKKPEAYKVFHLFTTEGARKFNIENPDCPEVFYQSYAFVMKNPFSDIFMWFPNLAVRIIEGENDGLLVPDSVKWGEFKGIYRGVGRRGISHCDEVDMRRMRFSRKKGDGVSDIIDVYKTIVTGLQSKGL
jgi:triacylglycerol lipase